VADDQREGVPPYLRIAAALRERILIGELQPGQMLPSITRIAQEEGVAKITAAKALKVLRSEGLTYSVQGWGTFVAGDAQAD
jgi:DNA-binding GntR family transcriptional regulator